MLQSSNDQQITLPRAKGTCTRYQDLRRLGYSSNFSNRCPIECRLSRMQTEWTCEVYLRLARHTKEIPFGSPITVKSEVEERIRRAQLAILNPSKSHHEFLSSGIRSDRHEVSFSTDLISVRITGRDVDDLSFVDLPGMNLDICENHADATQGSFNQSEMVDGKQTLKRSKALSLVLSRSRAALSCLLSHAKVSSSLPGYNLLTPFSGSRKSGSSSLGKAGRSIRKPYHSCVIITAAPYDDQHSYHAAVLTKPDRIAPGEHSNWMKLLENQQERFKHGWHCVKQSDQQQLDDGISWEDARKNEIQFFENAPHWSSLEEAIKSRLGTEFLTQALGTILFELICAR
jgi:hypothetical protein